MRKIILALTIITLLIAGTSVAFADDEARDAMIDIPALTLSPTFSPKNAWPA